MAYAAAKKAHLKRVVGAVGGIAVALAMGLLFRPSGLPEQGCLILAILAGAIVWWICDVLPEFATAMLMVVLFVLVGDVAPATVLVTFANPMWWLLVGAFSIGLGMKETGLLKRMALAIVRRFPSSFAAQAAGFIACGTLLGPLIPSMAAKVSLLAPLSMEISDDLGYERRGREANGLFLAMFTGVQNVAPAVISASIIGYALLALYPESVQAQFDFMSWLLAALPWFIPLTLLNYACIVLLYRPRKRERDKVNGSLSRESMSRPSQPEGMSRAEKQMAVITAVTVLLWVTQGVHGLPAWIPAIGALVVMTACGIINKSNISSGMSWPSLIFIGIVLGLGDVFAEAGINDWIIGAFSPALTALAANPYLFIAGIALITVLVRFIVVSQIAFLNIFMAFTMPIALALGINPWVIGMACYAVISPWFVKYQNPIYLAAYYSVDGKMAKHSALAKYCVLYTAVSIVCLLVAVPVWQGMGLL